MATSLPKQPSSHPHAALADARPAPPRVAKMATTSTGQAPSSHTPTSSCPGVAPLPTAGGPSRFWNLSHLLGKTLKELHLTVWHSFTLSLRTKLGKDICVSPKEMWVQNYMKHLDQQSRTQKTRTLPTTETKPEYEK